MRSNQTERSSQAEPTTKPLLPRLHQFKQSHFGASGGKLLIMAVKTFTSIRFSFIKNLRLSIICPYTYLVSKKMLPFQKIILINNEAILLLVSVRY